MVYDFPKTRLVDGPAQVEARIDQNAQLSGQLSLWNQQGSRVRRGPLLVIPIGHALLYAQAIYLQADRSPMPELRLVVLALQERLVYAPTFEAALTDLFGAASGVSAPQTTSQAAAAASPEAATGPARQPDDVQKLIAEAAKNLTDYQRLTAEGKLGEAGQKLEQLKRALDELSKRRYFGSPELGIRDPGSGVRANGDYSGWHPSAERRSPTDGQILAPARVPLQRVARIRTAVGRSRVQASGPERQPALRPVVLTSSSPSSCRRPRLDGRAAHACRCRSCRPP